MRIMSSNGEFSTMSSGEVPSLPKSLPSSREATAEANSNSAGGYMPLRDFLDRFSLPRVVRLEGSAGRPVLLYKQQQRSLRVTATLLIHRYRHDVKVGPEIVIPEGYPGWFSVITGNNGATGGARVYRRVESLVRAGVPAFLLAAPLRAYILTHSKMENGNLRAHYTKTTIRAGEVLRLVAIFQDTRRCSSVSFNITGGSSERDQYAQCLDPHGREVFAPLSARGEFYAVCQSESSSSATSIDTASDAILYKVQHLARRQLPLRVRLIAGPLPVPLPREYGGLMQLESSTRGPIVLGCLVPETPVYNPEMLELLVSGNGAPRVRRARLGYPSEARLLASPKMQRLLTACSRAVGDRATEPRVAPQKLHHSEDENLKEMHLKKIKPKPETKPILQSLREGLEQLTKPSANNGTAAPSSAPGNNVQNQNRSSNSSSSGGSTSTSSSGPGGFLERISKLRQANRSRNPAKKSASFTFAVRPEIAMKAAAQKYSSLEPVESGQGGSGSGSGGASSKQPVQRSVSTSVLEVTPGEAGGGQVQVQPDYSRVRDSLSTPSPTPRAALPPELPPPPPLPETNKPDEIYAEICENHVPVNLQRRAPSPVVVTPSKCPGSHVMARIKILVKDDYRNSKPYAQELFDSKKLDRKYVNSIFVSSSHNHKGESLSAEDEIIYNTVF